MSNAVYNLLYARLHTRKYTTGSMYPESSTNRDVHNASLETNYEMTATMTMVNSETQELRNMTVPRSKVIIIGDQPAGTQPSLTKGLFMGATSLIIMMFTLGFLSRYCEPPVAVGKTATLMFAGLGSSIIVCSVLASLVATL